MVTDPWMRWLWRRIDEIDWSLPDEGEVPDDPEEDDE